MRVYVRERFQFGHEDSFDNLQFLVLVIERLLEGGIGRAEDVGQTDGPFAAEFGQLSLDLLLGFGSSFPKYLVWPPHAKRCIKS